MAKSKLTPCLSVIMPVYNEKPTLQKVITQVLKQPQVIEIIVVDDGSTDEAVSNLASNPRIKIFKHKTNLGKGAAITTGIKKAQSQYVIIQDADLEYSPSDYPKLIQILEKNQSDFIVGNRWNANQRGYKLAQLGNWFLTILYQYIYNSSVTDPYSGSKLGKTSVWKKLKLKSSGFEIEAEIMAKLSKNRFKVTQTDIKYFPRSYSEGKKIGPIDVIKGVRRLIELK